MIQVPGLNPERRLTIEDLRFDPPRFSLDEIRQLAQQHYGLEGEFLPLDGERDQNHRLRCADGKEYVLKISGSTEPAEVVEMQVQALCHIEAKDPLLPVPRMIRSLDGRLICSVNSEVGKHAVRLLSWLPGLLYQDGAFPSRQGLRNLGGFIARLGLALSDFEHPAASHFMPWNMANGLVFSPQLRELMHDVLDEKPLGDVDLSDQVLSDWFRDYFVYLEKTVYPLLSKQRWQVIHQDGHGANLLRSSKQDEAVTGVIDFGDMIHGPLICDLSACASDFIEAADDPLKVATEMCAGYHQILPLASSELELMLDLMLVRQIMVLQLFEFRRRNMDHPPDFVTDHQPLVIAGLKRLSEIDRHEFVQQLKEAVKNA